METALASGVDTFNVAVLLVTVGTLPYVRYGRRWSVSRTPWTINTREWQRSAAFTSAHQLRARRLAERLRHQPNQDLDLPP